MRNLQSIVDNAPGHFVCFFQFNFQNNFVFDSRIPASTVQARHVKYVLDPFAVKDNGDSVSAFGPDTPPFSDLTGCLKKVKRSALVRLKSAALVEHALNLQNLNTQPTSLQMPNGW